MKKYVPTYEGTLRKKALEVPRCISECSGIRVFGTTGIMAVAKTGFVHAR